MDATERLLSPGTLDFQGRQIFNCSKGAFVTLAWTDMITDLSLSIAVKSKADPEAKAILSSNSNWIMMHCDT